MHKSIIKLKWLIMTGIVAHTYPEWWLKLAGQVAHWSTDYSVGNVLLTESQTTKSENLSILGHSHDLL